MGRYRLFCAFLLALSCKSDLVIEPPTTMDLEPYILNLPPGFPEPFIPADNALTIARVELGKLLFHDTRFSRDNTISCASCHLQSAGFADNEPISTGVEGILGFRNATSLANVAYQTALFMDGGVPSLEVQVLAPLDDKTEMDKSIIVLAEELKADVTLNAKSLRAYGREMDPYVITRAIAAFERTLISGNSPYDQFLNGDASALSPQQQSGMNIFFSAEANCSACHSGQDLSDRTFRNIGLYVNYEDKGRERVTANPEDNGKFKVPTLRNIAVTAPYMHDGSLHSLEEVINHFADGGMNHPLQDPLVTELNLTAEQKADLLAFLESLTDRAFLENPAFAP